MLSSRLEVRWVEGDTYSGFLPPELWSLWNEHCKRGGHALFSYHTPIAWLDYDTLTWIVPDVYYSPETDEHQHMARVLIGACEQPQAKFDKALLG